ncbi:MAG: Uma2 family endonuclease [Labilithrix sp.]|nr:Uma2 family endonuclease [Labilithrix sp.]
MQPLRFPASEPEWEKLPESRRHVRLCKALFEMLRAICCPQHTVGWDQFVYFDAMDPKRKLAPDAFVKLGVPDHDFDSYLVWEEGTPEVAFEVLSPSDTPERWTFKEKLRRYHALGVRELLCINVDAKPGKRLRAWDRIEHDLVERVVTGEKTPCLVLGVTLLVGHVDVYPVALRIARDAAGLDLVLTESEAADEASAQRDAVMAERDEASAQRDAAMARIAALEKQLAAKPRAKRRSTTRR